MGWTCWSSRPKFCSLALIGWASSAWWWDSEPLLPCCLRPPQRQQRNLRRHADPHREAKSSQPAIHIKRSLLPGAGSRNRQPIEPRHKRSNQPRRTDAVIHNLNLHLSTMRVAGQAELDPQLSSAPKRIRIMREQHIRHVVPDQMFNLRQHRAQRNMIALTARHVVALVIDAHQIKPRAIMLDHRRLRPQQPHSLFREQPLRLVFHTRINFVIAIASPNAQRSAQPAQLGKANVQRIAFACNEVSCNERNVRLQRVRHVHSASNFERRHVVANVYVAKLCNTQPVQLWRKIGPGHIDALDRIAQSSRRKSIGSGQEWKTSRHHRSILKESSARGVESSRNRFRMTPKPRRREVSHPFNCRHRLNRQKSKNRSGHPQARKGQECLAKTEAAKSKPRNSMPQQRIRQRHQQCSRQRNQSGPQPEPPVGIREPADPSPRPQKPESLHGVESEKKQGKNKNSSKNQG